MSGEAIFWITALVLFLVVEAVTVGLASVWFAVGALAALICACMNALLRGVKAVPVHGAVLETDHGAALIFGESGTTGCVRIDGVDWTARSTVDERVIGEGAQVVIREIQGVKLIVEPKNT